MNDFILLLIVGVLVFGCVECMALYKDVNGKLLTTVVAAITLIIGYAIPR